MTKKLNLVATILACLPVSKIDREAVSNAVKRDALQRWSKKPGFPQEEAAVDALLSGLEGLIPDPNGSKSKKYFEFLLKLLFGMNPAGFVMGEDDYKVKPLMQRYHTLTNKGVLSGADADLQKYNSLEDLESALDKVDREKKDSKKGAYTPEQEEIIRNGSKVIYQGEGWVVHLIPKGADQSGLEAAKILCDNEIHNVKWCVGRDTSYGRNYISQGNFYVLEKDGNSEFAISTDSYKATIWNPADTPIYETGGDSQGRFERLQSIANAKKIEVDFKALSALPAQIVPVLKAVTAQDAYLAERIPNNLLVEGDFTALAKLLHSAPIADIVEDLNENYPRTRSINAAAAVMSVAVDPKVNISFKEGFPLMNTETFIGFLEAYAAKVGKVLPKDAEDFLIAEIEKL